MHEINSFITIINNKLKKTKQRTSDNEDFKLDCV
jgi:hypothetical protein